MEGAGPLDEEGVGVGDTLGLELGLVLGLGLGDPDGAGVTLGFGDAEALGVGSGLSVDVSLSGGGVGSGVPGGWVGSGPLVLGTVIVLFSADRRVTVNSSAFNLYPAGAALSFTT